MASRIRQAPITAPRTPEPTHSRGIAAALATDEPPRYGACVGIDSASFELVPGWGSDNGVEFGIVSGQATDSGNRLYVVDREPNPGIVVMESDGAFVAKLGADLFKLPHDIFIDEADRMLVTDLADHVVRICTTDGEVLQTIGTPGEPGAPGAPFNRPSRAVTAPDGEIYVADGYGQHHVHRMSADGELIATWGGQGAGPGQFSLPHNIWVTDDRVYIADREPNHRVCVFDRAGNFQDVWVDHHGVCGLFMTSDGVLLTAEEGKVAFHDSAGKETGSIAVDFPPSDRAHGPHSVWIDSDGSLYLSEVGVENLLYKYRPV